MLQVMSHDLTCGRAPPSGCAAAAGAGALALGVQQQLYTRESQIRLGNPWVGECLERMRGTCKACALKQARFGLHMSDRLWLRPQPYAACIDQRLTAKRTEGFGTVQPY